MGTGRNAPARRYKTLPDRLASSSSSSSGYSIV